MANKLTSPFLLLSLALLPLVAPVAFATSYPGLDQLAPSPGNTTYLIDPATGNDANPPGQPWRTFGRLNAVRLAPGDTVIIAPGRQEETLKPSGGGSAEKPVVIRFQSGMHTIGIKDVIRLPMFVSNSMDSTDPKPVGIYLENVRNFRLEGDGVDGPKKTTILYDGRMVQIFNDHSENISFSGLVFDLKRPTISEFRVLESGPASAVIQVAGGSDYAVENGKFVWKGDWGQGRPLAQEAVPDEGRCQRTKMPRGWSGAGQTEAKATELGARKVRLEFASEGTGLTTGHQYQFRLGKRDVVAVHNARSKDIVFRDCDFYALSGMGFVSQFTENITYQRVNVAPPNETLRTCAAWADIFHFSNCKGDILVNSCRLSGMQDDALNCHGTHLRIVGKPAENQLLMRFMHGQTFGFAAFQPGDEVAVINHDNLREYEGNPHRKVTAVERVNDMEWLLTLDASAPAFEKDDALDNITWYPNLTARNNHFSMDPVRGFLITTRCRVLVENNTFHRPAMAGILIEDDASGWFESGPVRDMLIRNNRFVRCGIAITPQTKNDKPGDWVHENIRIEDNVFSEGGHILARNVKGLTLTDNRAPEGAVRVETNACTNVKEEKNQRLSRWSLGAGITTIWKLDGSKLPHNDFVEQGGRRVGQIVRYSIDGAGLLSVTRTVVWPSLRIFPNDTHGSFIQTYGPEANPGITVDGQPMGPIKVREVVLDGTLTFIGSVGELLFKQVTFPSFDKYTALDRWTLTNSGPKPVSIAVAPLALKFEKDGPYGRNLAEVFSDAPSSALLEPGKSLSFSIMFSARLAASAPVSVDGSAEEARRRAFIEEINAKLQIETPDPVLNRAFAFAKWRVAEAINDTRGGLMLAPGNGRYYAATWCNDNVEYAGPFFPFLGETGGNAGSLNAYRQYIPFMKPAYERIPCSVVAEGAGTWGPFDRGDAAMYAYGASRFCLALGDRAIAEELWKGIVWTLEYCKRRLTPEGVVASDRDELEGRLPAGKANLCTASLYYGGLRSAADLGRSLGKTQQAANYDQQADVLAAAIERHFGSTVEGFHTYRYYDGNDVLRAWICAPLAMGILDRKQGTLDALFSPRMWSPDGVVSKSGDKVFWDRSTLFALRAAFQAGDTARALDRFGEYTRRRLLGEHVPYAVEAFPEGGQGHLASESGLYCRIVVEGLFGILPTGLGRFQCTPRLPDNWPSMALRHVKAFGSDFDVVVERRGQKLQVRVLQEGKVIREKSIAPGETLDTVLKGKQLP